MNADTDLEVPVQVRSHEQAQLEEWVPAVREHFEQADLNDQAAAIGAIEGEILAWDGEREDEAFVRTLSLTLENWQELVKGLERVQSEYGRNRVEWLRRKLFKRVRGRVEDLA